MNWATRSSVCSFTRTAHSLPWERGFFHEMNASISYSFDPKWANSVHGRRNDDDDENVDDDDDDDDDDGDVIQK